LIEGLQRWAKEEASKYPYSRLETQTGASFALSVGWIESGDIEFAQKVPGNARFGGVIAFPPTARLQDIRKSFLMAFEDLVDNDPWLSHKKPRLEWGDLVDESCQANEDSEFIQMAVKAIHNVTGRKPRLYYGHSTSDIRYPMLYWNAQAFGVGPLAGGIATADEWLDWEEYLKMIIAVTEMLKFAA
jgi:hypothetical protein